MPVLECDACHKSLRGQLLYLQRGDWTAPHRFVVPSKELSWRVRESVRGGGPTVAHSWLPGVWSSVDSAVLRRTNSANCWGWLTCAV